MTRHCSSCGSPLPDSMYLIEGGTCNACRTINAINKQYRPNTSNNTGGDDFSAWWGVGIFVFLNIVFDFFPLQLVWWMIKCMYCVAIGMWTGTCVV